MISSNKRYNNLSDYYQNKYQTKVFKISLNSNLSCPNIDGTLGNKGCIYCLNRGGEFAGNPKDDLLTQFNNIKKMMIKKWPTGKYIGYFQANTNTYAPLEKLKSMFEEVIKYPDVIGLNISTRCDAVSDEVLDYLEDLNKRTNLTIELGLQSMHNETLKLINRGHDLNSFEKMVKKLQERNISVVVHIINGLPYEDKNKMLETVKYLNDLNISGIKIHMLCVLKNTELANMYNNNEFKLLTKEEYIDVICDQLALLNPNIVIHRLTSDPDINDLIEPKWLIKKFCLLNDIDKELKKRDLFQAKGLTKY